SITIPNSVTSIGDNAFSGCSSLTSITIPDSVTSIGSYAFGYCSSLTSITIPDSVTYIGSGALCGCSSLKEFKGELASMDGRCLIINNSLIAFAPAGLTEYTIPNSVISIEECAFRDCSNLTSINIPDSVTSIGSYAFGFCSKLTSINIPDSVTSIGSFTFHKCSSLTSINIPNSVTSIGQWAFRYCSSLQNIICNPTNPPTGGEEMFDGISSSAKIYVPTGSGDAYKAATYWSNYKDMIVEM
ncbi:MAG: leucine-rich repeat domain-containing protein, partial [Rikenellaceae bacterium]|nr:leucine-rich repeat domain-containing protein [Rikenellaceae bacterium]